MLYVCKYVFIIYTHRLWLFTQWTGLRIGTLLLWFMCLSIIFVGSDRSPGRGNLLRAWYSSIKDSRSFKEGVLQGGHQKRAKPACQLLEDIWVGAMPCRGLLIIQTRSSCLAARLCFLYMYVIIWQNRFLKVSPAESSLIINHCIEIS